MMGQKRKTKAHVKIPGLAPHHCVTISVGGDRRHWPNSRRESEVGHQLVKTVFSSEHSKRAQSGWCSTTLKRVASAGKADLVRLGKRSVRGPKAQVLIYYFS